MRKPTKTSLKNKRFLKRQMRVLEAKQTECLNKRKQALEALAAIESDECKDSADLAGAILGQELGGNLANCCAEQSLKVSRAILNIANHNYGICGDCGENISVKRLQAVPWATRCISCQTIEEATRVA